MARFSFAAVVAVSFLVVACTKANDKAPEPSAQAPAPAQNAATQQYAPIADLCALVTQEEAEKILGIKLEVPQRQKGGDCWYLKQGGNDFGDVEFILSVPPVWVRSEKEFDDLVASQTKDMNENLKATGIAATPYELKKAEGVGAPAYFIDPGLYVMKIPRVLAVGLGGDKGVALAKIAVQRMP